MRQINIHLEEPSQTDEETLKSEPVYLEYILIETSVLGVHT